MYSLFEAKSSARWYSGINWTMFGLFSVVLKRRRHCSLSLVASINNYLVTDAKGCWGSCLGSTSLAFPSRSAMFCLAS